MKILIILLIGFLGVHCRPQSQKESPQSIADEDKFKKSTSEILQKIARVNEEHGYTPRKNKPQNYFHFPFSYSRNKEIPPRQIQMLKTAKPLSNEEEIPAGHTIKRKITHYQSIYVPNPYFDQNAQYRFPNNPFQEENSPLPGQNPFQMPFHPYTNPQQMYSQYMNSLVNGVPTVIPTRVHTGIPNSLPAEMATGIPNIPYQGQNQMNFYPGMQNNFPQNQSITKPLDDGNLVKVTQTIYPLKDETPHYNEDDLLDPDFNDLFAKPEGRQNWNWPGAQYFPIIIRDPFIQMYQAITSMVEYGPSVGSPTSGGAGCKGKGKPKTDLFIEGRSPKIANDELQTDEDDLTILEIDGLNINDKRTSKEAKEYIDNDEPKKINEHVFKRSSNKKKPGSNVSLEKRIGIQKTNNTIFNVIHPPHTLPNRQPEVEEEDLVEDEDESDKAEDISINSEGSKKVFSKDNTGNGIFIHKLRVRKGGVAIAGPGGIATAGSGGTAIVGPHGTAYAHPDSLAIAGSGAKVIAVDPNVSLSEILNRHNKTRNGNEPRFGKLVATGPVIYFNKGDIKFDKSSEKN